MKVSFFQGQTPARADLAILALMYSTWLTFPVRLPTLELSCQVSGSLLPVLQAVLSCTQRVQLIFQHSHFSVGEFSWIVISTETQKQNLGDLVVCWKLPPVTGFGIRTPIAKVNLKAERLKKKKEVYMKLVFSLGSQEHFLFERKC